MGKTYLAVISYEKGPLLYICFFYCLGFHRFYVLFAKPFIGPKLV